MTSTSLDSRESDTPSAAEILARLERYAAAKRSATPEALAEPPAAAPTATQPTVTQPIVTPSAFAAPTFAPPSVTPAPVTPPTVRRTPTFAPRRVAPTATPPTFATDELAPEAAATETLPDADEHLPHRRSRAGTVDLFPYDLAASIVGCAVIIMACIAFGRPFALVLTAGFIAGGEYLRRRRWFPSLGVNLMIGTVVGLLFVLVS